MKLVYLFLLHPFFASLCYSQGVTVWEGYLTNVENKQPLTNAVIFQSATGYSSLPNEEGKVRFVYPNISKDSLVTVAAIGFKTLLLPASALKAMDELELTPVLQVDLSYGQADAGVLVAAAVDSIPFRFSATPVVQEGFYLETLDIEKVGFAKISEATLRIERFPDSQTEKVKVKQSRKIEWEGQKNKADGFALQGAFTLCTRSLETEIPEFLSKSGRKKYFFEIDTLMTSYVDELFFKVHFKPKNSKERGGREGFLLVHPESKAIAAIDYQLTEKGRQEIFKTGFSGVKITGQKAASLSLFIKLGTTWTLAANKLDFEMKLEDRLDQQFESMGKVSMSFTNMLTAALRNSAIRDLEEAMRANAFKEANSLDTAHWRTDNYLIPTAKMQKIIIHRSTH